MSLYSGKQMSRRGYQGSIGSFVGGLAKKAIGLALPGPIKAAVSVFGGLKKTQQPMNLPLLPGGGSGFFAPKPMIGPGAFVGVGSGNSSSARVVRIRQDGKPYKQPRMNAANPRALKRAIRRVVRFGQLARSVGYGRPPKAVKNVKATRKGRR